MPSSEASLLDFPGLPPFDDKVATAPLLRLSLDKLLANDADEVRRLWKACTELGFFYLDIRNAHGRVAPSIDKPDESVEVSGNRFLDHAYSLFPVAQDFFALPVEEKEQYDFKSKGSYFGYKGIGQGIIDSSGTRDRNDFYNTSKDDILGLSAPLPAPANMKSHRDLFADFIKESHSIVVKILQHLNDQLHLPKGTLQSLHQLKDASGDQVRFVRSLPQPVQDRKTALGAHTDFGSVTLLFNQLGGLQILPPGKAQDDAAAWLYVRPLNGHCIVNLGDALVKFSRGILRSNTHRVVNPPGEEQGALTRYSLVYFNRPADHVMLHALSGSDLIDEAVRQDGGGEEEAVSSRDWVLARALGRRGVGAWEKTVGTEAMGSRTVSAPS